MSLAVFILWKVKIGHRQKAIVAFFLYLNVFMVAAALARSGGLDHGSQVDQVWLFLRTQIEGCVAIIMICVTAFRSIFIAEAYAESNRAKSWRSSVIQRVIVRRNFHGDEHEFDKLPNIPPATITGLSTFIKGGHSSIPATTLQSSTGSEGFSDWSGSKGIQQIEVRNTLESHVSSV